MLYFETQPRQAIAEHRTLSVMEADVSAVFGTGEGLLVKVAPASLFRNLRFRPPRLPLRVRHPS